MKTILLLIAAITISNSAWSDDCKLAQPIAISADPMDQDLIFKNVVVTPAPRFTRPENYNPAQDLLELKLFNVKFNDKKINYVGAQVSLAGKSESVGFANLYSGSFLIQGRTAEINGVRTYTTKEVRIFTESQHAKMEATTQTSVTISGSKIIAVSVIAPVFRIWKVENGASYAAFTGEHQTLCVKSAQ